jgi:hypothetical protein
MCLLDNGGPEARLWSASRILGPSTSNPLPLPCGNLRANRAAPITPTLVALFILVRQHRAALRGVSSSSGLIRHTVPVFAKYCTSYTETIHREAVTITFIGPHQRGGNLHYLFEREPR